MLKKIFGCLLTCLLVLCLSACQSQPSKQEEVSSIEIGETYNISGEVKLLDDKHFVILENNADFQSDQEIKSYQADNYPLHLYPEIYFAEGTYEKIGDTYHLITQRSVRVEFKNVGNIQKKIVSRKTLDENSNPQGKYFTLAKKSGTYTVNGKRTVLTSDQKIPDSIDDFLAQYKYEPEELE